MANGTDRPGPADEPRSWLIEQTIVVGVGGKLVDPLEGRTLTAVTVRMPAFVATHLAAGLAVLSEIAEMMARSAYDETELVAALLDAARKAKIIDRGASGSGSD